MILNQWRTVFVAGSGILALLLGLIVAGHWPSTNANYTAFALAVGGCVSAVAAKSGWQHKANAGQAEVKP